MSAARFPALRANLNKFWELCDRNDSEAARRLRVKPQQFNEWRKGEHNPTLAARQHIAARLGVSEHALLYEPVGESIGAAIVDPEHGVGGSESPAVYARRDRARLLKTVRDIVRAPGRDNLVRALLTVIEAAETEDISMDRLLHRIQALHRPERQEILDLLEELQNNVGAAAEDPENARTAVAGKTRSRQEKDR